MGPMGPMPPMGPPMGPIMGGGNWGGAWLIVTLVVVLALAMGLAALALWRDGGPVARFQPRTPGEILRDRYAQGELTREKYREALVDILKDRYVRGELDIQEYRAELARLLQEPGSTARQEVVQSEQPSPRQ